MPSSAGRKFGRVLLIGKPRSAEAESSLQQVREFLRKRGCDVLVTDVNLGRGRMDGYALAAELRHRWPALGVVVISGYGPSLDRCGALAPHQRHLLKPFAPRALVQAVHELSAPATASAR